MIFDLYAEYFGIKEKSTEDSLFGVLFSTNMTCKCTVILNLEPGLSP